MSFAAPWLLLALLLVPAAAGLYVWWERRRSRGAEPWATPALMPSVSSGSAPWWHRHVGPVLYLLAAAALIVSFARPEHDVEKEIEQASVMLVTDRSGSMRSRDLEPTRMEAVKRAASNFLDQVPQEIRVGALAFNQKTRLLASPTTDRERVRTALNTLTGAGSTATGDGLGAALAILRPQGLRGPQTPAAIVLLSDGKNVRGRDPVRLARRAGRLGVRIFTIALGTDTGTLTSKNADGSTKVERVPPDRVAMRQIAEASGGTTADAPTTEALEQVYEELGSAVATEPGKDQLTSIPVGVALLLLVAGAGVALRLTGRIV